jgi:ribonucleoside-diphosphate reductase alpha chain
MKSPSYIKSENEITYFKLNNEINRPVNGIIPLHKDKEAVKAYFLEEVNPNTVYFSDLEEKINYLIDNDYIEKEFIEKYNFKFIKKLFKFLYNKFSSYNPISKNRISKIIAIGFIVIAVALTIIKGLVA